MVFRGLWCSCSRFQRARPAGTTASTGGRSRWCGVAHAWRSRRGPSVSFVMVSSHPLPPTASAPSRQGTSLASREGSEGAKAPMPTTDGALREIPGGFYPHTPFVQSGGRLWVAHHDTVAVVPESPFTKGWLAVQSVPSEGHVRIPSGLPFTPARRRDLCAILWLMALWRRDERGLQGNCW